MNLINKKMITSNYHHGLTSCSLNSEQTVRPSYIICVSVNNTVVNIQIFATVLFSLYLLMRQIKTAEIFALLLINCHLALNVHCLIWKVQSFLVVGILYMHVLCLNVIIIECQNSCLTFCLLYSQSSHLQESCNISILLVCLLFNKSVINQ